MPKKLTSKQKNIIIKNIAEGDTIEGAANKAGTTASTVVQNDSLISEAKNAKKEAQNKVNAEIGENIKEIAKSMIMPIQEAIKAITRETIAKQSASANATTMAILVDKMQLLTGGVTENIALNGDSTKLAEFLKGKLSANYKKDNPIIKQGTDIKQESDTKIKPKFKML